MPERYAPFYCPDSVANPPRRNRRRFDYTVLGPPPPPFPVAPARHSSIPAPRCSEPIPQGPASLANEIRRMAEVRRNEQRRPNLDRGTESICKNNKVFAAIAIFFCLGACIIAPAMVIGFRLGSPGLWIAVGISATTLLCFFVCCITYCCRSHSRSTINVQPLSGVSNNTHRELDGGANHPAELPPSYSAAVCAEQAPRRCAETQAVPASHGVLVRLPLYPGGDPPTERQPVLSVTHREPPPSYRESQTDPLIV